MAFYVPSLTNNKITQRPGETTFVHNLVVYERKYWHNICRYATQYERFGYRRWPFPTLKEWNIDKFIRLQQVKTQISYKLLSGKYYIIYITIYDYMSYSYI